MSIALDLSGDDVTVNSLTSGGLGGQLVPTYEWISSSPLSETSTSATLYVNPALGGTFKVAAVSVVFGTASSSGTMQIEVATGTQAVASGTNQLTGTMSLAGTANTVVTGTVIASPTTVSSGARINVILGGTLTSLANCVVTVALQRIS